MGRGRKTETINVNGKEKGCGKWTWNCSVTARNLRKSDLAGVIFGCKHGTIKECLKEYLFGLPALHISYVKNIEPGLPLFLFNYSDRKLHGIFEAASHGKLNINPNGWTTDGSDTPFPAQVRVRIRMECQPLPEDHFRPIISNNYYARKHFWFELDRDQTSKLITMFSSVPMTSINSFSTNMDKKGVKTHWLNTTVSYPNKSNTQCGSSWDASGLGEESWVSETVLVGDNAEKNEDGFGLVEPNNWPSFDAAAGGVQPSQQRKWSSLFKDSTTSDDQKGIEDITALTQGLSHPFDAFVDENGEEVIDDEHAPLKPSDECTSSSASTEENISKHSECEDSRVDGMISDTIYSPQAALALEMELSGGVQSIVAKLVEEVIELKSSHLKQAEKICSLQMDLVESKLQIRALKDRLNLLESGSSDEQEKLELTNEPVRKLDDSILIIGGFDGSLWLSSLDYYYPSRDVLESLCPMSLGRSHASAAKLNGEVYVFGGVYDNLCYDIVESYNPVKNLWTIRPSLSQRKRNLAGISYNEKIFAIGGGNGVESLSEVEMFDLDVGRWIPSRSLLQKRFAPAAAEINGAIFVAGGFDGQYCLKSVERFDPREYSWRRLQSMSTMRGCHSLAVLNEKLYAIGGFDGEKMVSTVEVFDPRKSSWMMEESMKESRGYSNAVVIGDAIYVIGGLSNGEQILDTVECYKEGVGWQAINSKAIGKRAFFSALR